MEARRTKSPVQITHETPEGPQVIDLEVSAIVYGHTIEMAEVLSPLGWAWVDLTHGDRELCRRILIDAAVDHEKAVAKRRQVLDIKMSKLVKTLLHATNTAVREENYIEAFGVLQSGIQETLIAHGDLLDTEERS